MILATHNENKVKEFQSKFLSMNLSIPLETLSDLGYSSEIKEDGLTFEDNAMIKADTVFDRFGKPVLGEDSGIVVPFLSGVVHRSDAEFLYRWIGLACDNKHLDNYRKNVGDYFDFVKTNGVNPLPGVLSKRFGFIDTAEDKNRLLQNLIISYKELAGENFEPNAEFVTMICYKDGKGTFFAHGTCPGLIIQDFRGSNGFGYDPVFYMPQLGKTMAELTTEEKNTVSHRQNAIINFIEKYKKNRIDVR